MQRWHWEQIHKGHFGASRSLRVKQGGRRSVRHRWGEGEADIECRNLVFKWERNTLKRKSLQHARWDIATYQVHPTKKTAPSSSLRLTSL